MHLTDARQVAAIELDGRPLAQSTIDSYRHRGSQYLRALRENGHSISYAGLVSLFEDLRYAWGSFEDTRNRMRYALAEQIREHAREADRLRRSGDRAGARGERQAAESLADGLDDLQRVRHRDRHEPRDHAGDRFKPDTRYRGGDRARQALKVAHENARERGYPDWRVDMVHATDDDELYCAMIVQAVTGCRPGEVVAGVDLETDGDELHAVIMGEKVSKNGVRGQPDRTVVVARWRGCALTDELHAVVDAAGGELTATLEYPVKRYSERVGRLARGRDGFGGLGYRWLSPYSFRHQWSADQKANGADEKTLAAAMGHRNTESQSVYGLTHLGRSGFAALARASAPLDIKQRGPAKSLRDQITRRQASTEGATESSTDTATAKPETDAEADDDPEVENGPVTE